MKRLNQITKDYTLMLFFALITGGSLSAQDVKITKIADTNLFKLEDGRTVKMAGLDVPARSTPGENISKLVGEILHYENELFLNHKFEILPAGRSTHDSATTLVYIIKQYDLGKVEYNKRFLELGYGRFINNVDSLHADEYKKTEKEAIENKEGLWSLRLPEVKDTLDRKYSLSELTYYEKQDSLYRIDLLRKRSPHIVWQVTGQAFSGVFIGSLGAITIGAISGLAFNTGGPYGGLGPAFMGMAAGYMLGAPMGTYAVAKANNPALSYWATLGFSSLTVIAGAGIALSGPQDHTNKLWIIPAVMPLVGSLIYVNSIAPNPVKDNVKLIQRDFQEGENIAFKDIYNKNMQFRINIFSIPF